MIFGEMITYFPFLSLRAEKLRKHHSPGNPEFGFASTIELGTENKMSVLIAYQANSQKSVGYTLDFYLLFDKIEGFEE